MRIITKRWLLLRASFILILLLGPFVEPLVVDPQFRFNTAVKLDQILQKAERVIYKDEGPIDLLFLGPSNFARGIDVDLIRKELVEKFNDQSFIVERIAHNFIGRDLDYFILNEILKRRVVRSVVLSTSLGVITIPHNLYSFFWSPYHSELTSINQNLDIYSQKILNSYRVVLKKMIPLESETVDDRTFLSEGEKPSRQFTLSELSLTPDSEVLLYTNDASERELLYKKLIHDLGRAKDVEIYYLSIPFLKVLDLDLGHKLLLTRNYTNHQHFGITLHQLFRNIDESDRESYFLDSLHFNDKGKHFFTHAIFPALVDIIKAGRNERN